MKPTKVAKSKKAPEIKITGKVFTHNKELDKIYIHQSFDKQNFDEKFYNVDKISLNEFLSPEQRTSKAIYSESWSDNLIYHTMMSSMVHLSKTLTSNPETAITLVEVSGENYATLDGKTIHLSIASLFDHRIPFYTRLNICYALSIHEAYHVRYTTPDVETILYNRGLTIPVLTKTGSKLGKRADLNQINKVFTHPFHMTLSNIIEDKRIEKNGMFENPGYVYYFDEIRKYCVWEHTNSLLDPKRKLDYTNEDEFYNNLTSYIMYKYLMPEVLKPFTDKEKQPAKFVDLTEKVDKILTMRDVKTYHDALFISSELLKLYPDNQKDKQAEKNKASSKSGPAIVKGTGLEKAAKGKLSKELAETLAEILDDELEYNKEEIHEINSQDVHSREYKDVKILPAPIVSFDSTTYNKSLELSKTITRNLSFLDSRFNRVAEEYEMLNGELDEDALYGIRHNKNLFYEEIPSPGYSMDLGVLIDESGSMGGKKIQQAKEVALALAIALHDSKHINFFCYGHTANTGGHPITMYKYFDSTDKKCRNINSLFSVESRSNNADGYAISHMGDVLNKGKSKQKVMIVISDGQPAASCYGGDSGEKHVRQVVTRLEKQGMFVVQIAIENFNSAKMFTHYIPFTGASLGQNLKKVLTKKLNEISNMI